MQTTRLGAARADVGADTAVVFQGKTYGFADEGRQAVRVAAGKACARDARDAVSHAGGGADHPPLGEATARAFPTWTSLLAAGMSVAPPTEAGTQTDTHPVERHVDKDYEGTSGRVATCAARGQLTARRRTARRRTSHFRRENTTQVWLPKRNETQTVVTKGTTMLQKKRYIGGMRGAPDVKLNVVNVELDLGQPYEH